MVFMLNIVLRAFDRIFKRIIGLQDYVEAETIACIRIVGMAALSKITKHPIYRSRVGVRAHFQNFVIVDELRGFHHMPPFGYSLLYHERRLAGQVFSPNVVQDDACRPKKR
jgi:hypothetical protein